MYEDYDYTNTESRSQQPQIDPATRARIEKKAAKRERRKRWGRCIAYALVFGLISGSTFVGINIVGSKIQSKLEGNNSKNQAIEDNREVKESEDITKEEPKKEEKEVKKSQEISEGPTVITTYDVSEVAANVMPSVVSITNKSIQEVQMMFGYGSQSYEATSCGSGIIMGQNDDELLIVTNEHVIEDAQTITVGFINDDVVTATVKGKDADNDLAVVAVKKSDISDETMDKISIAKQGDSGALVIGQPVVAIGNSMGNGQSVTSGIVSALDRQLTIENYPTNLIQTDAAINPGNSGGALLNLKGEVIGINSAKMASAKVEGMGYAIPISSAMPILDELMSRETRDLVEEKERGYLGISSTVELSKEYSEAMGIPTGVYITEVSEDSPAEAAGLRKGDVIKKFDGVSVSSISELKELLQYYQAGEEVEMLILRSDDGEYKEKTISMKLGGRKGTPLDPEKNVKDDTSDNNDDNPPQEKDGDGEEGNPSDNFKHGNGYGGYDFGFGFDPFDFFNQFN